jgi:mannose-6-phosphate isomerase
MSAESSALYPLRLDPIYRNRRWGGRRFADLFSAELPEGPVGEAWVLSDRDDHPSHVTYGPLTGQTIAQLLLSSPVELMGRLAGRFRRFPLLLKFLDVHEMLPVQVHPGGEDGRTEGWVVLEAAANSRIYAGMTDDITEIDMRSALDGGQVAECLSSFHPAAGDAVFIPGGTVHTLGNGVVVFEIQQNSGETFRLYDWGHVDRKTGEPGSLQVDLALASVDFGECEEGLVRPVIEDAAPLDREKLFDCDYFRLFRLRGDSPFLVGAPDMPSVLVCLDGSGDIEYGRTGYAMRKGDVFLMPASLGTCTCLPCGSAVTVLEISIPE